MRQPVLQPFFQTTYGVRLIARGLKRNSSLNGFARERLPEGSERAGINGTLDGEYCQ